MPTLNVPYFVQPTRHHLPGDVSQDGGHILGGAVRNIAAGQDFLCHDPYGRFHPELDSMRFGLRRWEGGQSLPSGSQHGPGAALRMSLTALSRTELAHWDLVLLK